MSRVILILSSSPKDMSRLRLDQEVRDISEGLKRSQKRNDFVLEQRWAVRPIDVRRAMLDCKPNIVQFCGHGKGEEGIALENELGETQLVTSETLAEFFALFADQVECVVLNTCYSEPQSAAISQSIKYVIGMKKQIGDKAAIEFSVAFYDALWAGESIEFAYKLSCNAIKWAGLPEHLTPILMQKKTPPSIIDTKVTNTEVVLKERNEQRVDSSRNQLLPENRQKLSAFIDKVVFVAQKTHTYEKVIELIDVYKSGNILTKEDEAYLILKEAILFQQNGNIARARKALRNYALIAGDNMSAGYYICKGKIISQTTKDPKKLTYYIDT